MKTIMVLMSTYNGQTYLREQINSILEQDCERVCKVQIQLMIRDDGSTDGTQEILEEYHAKYPEQISWVQGENLGVIGSFFDLLQNAREADYYAFADQDDYWLAHKLSRGILAIDKMAYSDRNNANVVCDRPLLYACRPKLVDESLLPIESEIERPEYRPGFGNALIENIVTGCTAVFNPILREMVIYHLPEFTQMHDRWLYLVASCFGKIHYDEQPGIYYRQHSKNELGHATEKVQEVKTRMVQFHQRRRDISRQAEEFVRIFAEDEDRKDLKLLKTDRTVQKNLALAKELVEARTSPGRRVRLVKRGLLYRQRPEDDRIFQWLIRMGSY